MTRFRIGLFLLIVLLAAGMWAQIAMQRICDPISRELSSAAESAQSEDWERSVNHFGNAGARWQRGWRVIAALADHEPMEDIDALMARMRVFASEQDGKEFAAGCAELSRRIQAVADAHRLNWWNLA